MASSQGQIKKIYRLETIGYDTLHTQFSNLSNDLLKIKKLIIELQGKKIGLSGEDLSKVNQQIIAAVETEKKLETQLNATNEASQTSISSYFQLNQAYQMAKKSAQDLAVTHGIESKEALEAAAAAEVYKQKLIEINNLVKSGGKTLAPVIPIQMVQPVSVTTPNASPEDIANLEKMGDVVTDLEAKEAAAANEAFAMGQVNMEAAQQIKVAGDEVVSVTTKYERYTGSIRQNITAQIENEQQLSKNRTAQKEIQQAITGQGAATDQQIARLAQLREEEQLLIESNKALTITVRNQTKEFLAGIEGLDEMQAQLNQLQQSYEALSAAEKASPFGQELKAEIDVLEPKVFALENELGIFSRRVGDYPRLWAGAFKTLNTELDSVQGKIVSGNFTGPQLATLTAQEKVLANATKVLGQEFASTAAQQAAFKEQARLVGITFGTDSSVFKNFAAQIAVANTELKKTDQQLATTGKTGSNAFTKLYSGLRQIANVIPGIGIGGLVLLLLSPLESLATSFLNISDKATKAAKDVNTFAEKQKIVGQITADAAKSYAEEVTRVEILEKIITDHTLAIDKRRLAVDEYNKIADEGNKIDKETINNTALIEASINRQIELIKKRALAKAAENIIAKKAEDLFVKQAELEEKFPENNEARIKDLKDKAQAVIDEASRKLNVKPATTEEILSFVDLPEDIIKKGQNATAGLKILLDQRTKILLAGFNDQLKLIERNRQNLGGGTAGLKVLVDDIKNLNDELERITKIGLGFISETGGVLDKPVKTKDETIQNELRLIETRRLQEIAIENKRVNEIQKFRQLSFDEEIAHLNALQKINVDALNKKIALYNSKEKSLLLDKKKLSAEEQKDRAEFGEQITATELDTSKKINDIEKKRFDQNLKRLQDQLASELNQIEVNKNAVLDNINSTELQKLQAQIDADQKELDAKKKFYISLLFLNDQFNFEALQKAKDAISKQQQETSKDRQKLTGATIAEIKAQGEREIEAENIKFELLRSKILENENITADKRKKLLDALGQAHERTVLTLELNTLAAQEELLKTLYAFGLVSEKTFLDAQQKLLEKSNQLKANLNQGVKSVRDTFTGLKDLIQKGLISAFKINTDTDEGKQLAGVVGEIVAQSYDLALQAMNDYFDAEQKRIEQSLKLNLERLDMEEEQVKARATSQAEIASIEKEYAAKKRAEENKAHEQIKKSKRSEAKIAFAVELANIWSQAMSYPFPLDLIIGGILSGLAAARLSLTLNRINTETFAKGGLPGQKQSTSTRIWNNVKNVFGFGGKAQEVPTKGGEFGGKPHSQGGTDFQFKGNKYNAEVDELAVIRTRNAPSAKLFTVTGTQMQLASAANVIGGGVNFKPGASVKTHYADGGYLGSNLQAPVFVPAGNNFVTQASNNNDQKMDELITAVKDHQKSTDKRIDRFDVRLVTQNVTDHQKKLKQYSDIGTL